MIRIRKWRRDHITPEGAGDRKEERRFISNFHGKIAAGAKGGELMGVEEQEEEEGRIGKLGSLGGRHSACQIDGRKHVGHAAATGCRGERN